MKAAGEKGLIALTMSAKTKISPDDEAKEIEAKKKKETEPKSKNGGWAAGENHVLDGRFSHYRSVVERVIGYMKTTSSFLSGPVAASQRDKVSMVLLIVCALTNKKLREMPNLFTTDVSKK